MSGTERSCFALDVADASSEFKLLSIGSEYTLSCAFKANTVRASVVVGENTTDTNKAKQNCADANHSASSSLVTKCVPSHLRHSQNIACTPGVTGIRNVKEDLNHE